MGQYLTFVVEIEIVGYFLDAQEIAPEPMLKKYKEVDCLSSLSPP